MGFLDSERRLQKKLEREEQAAAARFKRENEEREARLRTLAEDKTLAPQDNKTVASLLSSLPAIDFREYLDIVKRNTGFDPSLVLYTRLAVFDEIERIKLMAQDRKLTDELNKKGIMPTPIVNSGDGELAQSVYYKPIPTIHPSKLFCGDDVNIKVWKFPFLIPLFLTLTEPRQPGIGLSFTKQVKLQDKASDKPEYDFRREITYKKVYVRFTEPASAVITGNGNKFKVPSLEAFDNRLAKAFKHPHIVTVREYHNFPQMTSIG